MAVAAVVLATLSLPKVYESTATIYVGGQETDQAENVDTNFGQQIARTYAALRERLLTVADRVRAEPPGRLSRTEPLGGRASRSWSRRGCCRSRAEGHA